ncbi:unnamed protein product [Mesocestoides corti]|uniref:Protein ARV n=1 Tax=Mesocestoides corti TaxID=53468 RepID=A0A0R3UHN4_MESCO|nr:unnamed protein product [Mesocestoides corti]
MFTCICCGEDSPNIYTEYSKEIINFELCKRCGKIVDKYVEYDFTVVAIDLLVCKIEAYRHILRNVEYPRILHLFILSCILNGFLAWIVTEDSAEFCFDVVQAAVNSELYFYIVLKTFLSFVFGSILFVLGRSLMYYISMLDIVKLLIVTNLYSLLGLFMHPWKYFVSSILPQHSTLFAPILSLMCLMPTSILSFKALTNAPSLLATSLCMLSCGLVFAIDSAMIKLRYSS